MPEGRQSSERTLSVYGKSVEQKDIQIFFDFASRKMSQSENKSDRKIDYELAYIIEQVVAKGSVYGTCQKVSAILKLSRYGRNPSSLSTFLKANRDVHAENNIEMFRKRTSKERIIKLIHRSE